MHLYEQYKAGKISREDYMERIEKGRMRMEEMEKARDMRHRRNLSG